MTDAPTAGRPPVRLTAAQRAEVSELARVGMSKGLIADHLGITRPTFDAILDRDPEAAHLYARGLAEGLAEIHRTAFEEAKAGNPAMIQLVLKTKGGWRETPQAVEHSGPAGGPIETRETGSGAAKLLAFMNTIAERSGTTGSSAGE